MSGSDPSSYVSQRQGARAAVVGRKRQGEACFLRQPGAGAYRSSRRRGHRHLSYGRLGARQNLPKGPMELWEAGPTGRWEPILAWSLVGRPGFSRHVSSPGAAATHTVGSMSATGAARKRGKPASGAGAGAGAGKLRRKVSTALWRAGVHPMLLDHYPHPGAPAPVPSTPGPQLESASSRSPRAKY